MERSRDRTPAEQGAADAAAFVASCATERRCKTCQTGGPKVLAFLREIGARRASGVALSGPKIAKSLRKLYGFRIDPRSVDSHIERCLGVER